MTLAGATMAFTFIGKEHRPWHVEVTDARVAEVVHELLDQPRPPNGKIFTVASPSGHHDIASAVVNSYIHAATNAPATARTFRTWGGTAAAAVVAAGARPLGPARSARPDLIAIDAAAYLLGNTREVARRSYVHPRALDAGRVTALVDAVADARERTGDDDLRILVRTDSVVEALVRELNRFPTPIRR